MATVSHLCLILNIIFCVAMTVSGNCDEQFDSYKCEYDIYCEEYIEGLNSWNSYIRNSDHRGLETECSTDIRFQGYPIDPINLKFTSNIKMYKEIPFFQTNYYDNSLLDIVISLDLSEDNYVEFPIFKHMINLVKINLSNNMLSEAKLSNIYKLPSLKEINLSHNHITHIQHATVELGELPLGKLENINLSYNNLLEVPDAVFETFSNLTVLDLSHNSIETVSQLSFEGVKKLTHLYMSHNKLEDINASLFRFSELKTLDLSENNLKNIKENDFKALTQLTDLNLKSNLISSIDKESFWNLHILNSLNLDNNELDLLDKDIFKNIDTLKVITISNNKFKTLPKSIFKGKSIESFSIVENNLEGSIVRGMFEGLQLVTVLDLSKQRLESIEDGAFYGLGELVILLLQNNNIKTLSPSCFNTLNKLNQLDLSYNQIKNIEFDMNILGSLETLSIRNNYLISIEHEHFQGLDSLQFLDLSNNNISRLESNSFKSLNNLKNFEISNNPLSGALEEDAFEGLNSLPSLDISGSLLTAIHNSSFNGMVLLNNLNMSRSAIQTVQFNAFIRTGAIVTLDLSYNNIKEFNVNSSDISNLDALYLNNNYIKVLDSEMFNQISLLTKLFLSHNVIENVDSSVLKNQKNLHFLDISNNPKFMFDILLIKNASSLSYLYLSVTKPGMSFHGITNTPLSLITLSNASIFDIKNLGLNELNHLDTLDLSHNKITKVDFGCFTNISTLTSLDLRFNKIIYIQPGAFIDNTKLHYLNISHNFLASLTFGMFRGLTRLNILDISFNNIDNLQNERLFDLTELSDLIADHNKIETIDAHEFVETLSKLSIGDNPIPCDLLVNLQKVKIHFEITALKLDENNNENVNGVTCNNKKHIVFNRNPNVTTIVGDNAKDMSILKDIRDILLQTLASDRETTKNKNEEYLANITSQISKVSYNSQMQLSNMTKLVSLIANKNDTIILLEKIFKTLTINSLKRPTTPVPITKGNATYENLLTYINKLKQQLEDTITFEKNSILNEVDVKLSSFKDLKAPEPVHEKLSTNTSESKPIFTETCVALILIILVCLVLYQFYKSGLFMRKRMSISTRELPDAMDSTL